MRIDWLVGAFLLLAAVDHFPMSGGWPRRWYEANVARGINPARWWEYSVSASLTVVLIVMLAGVSELVAVNALFGANAATILFGLVPEQMNADRGEQQERAALACVSTHTLQPLIGRARRRTRSRQIGTRARLMAFDDGPSECPHLGSSVTPLTDGVAGLWTAGQRRAWRRSNVRNAVSSFHWVRALVLRCSSASQRLAGWGSPGRSAAQADVRR